jgi:hypothetical protein
MARETVLESQDEDISFLEETANSQETVASVSSAVPSAISPSTTTIDDISSPAISPNNSGFTRKKIIVIASSIVLTIIVIAIIVGVSTYNNTIEMLNEVIVQEKSIIKAYPNCSEAEDIKDRLSGKKKSNLYSVASNKYIPETYSNELYHNRLLELGKIEQDCKMNQLHAAEAQKRLEEQQKAEAEKKSAEAERIKIKAERELAEQKRIAEQNRAAEQKRNEAESILDTQAQSIVSQITQNVMYEIRLEEGKTVEQFFSIKSALKPCKKKPSSCRKIIKPLVDESFVKYKRGVIATILLLNNNRFDRQLFNKIDSTLKQNYNSFEKMNSIAENSPVGREIMDAGFINDNIKEQIFYIWYLRQYPYAGEDIWKKQYSPRYSWKEYLSMANDYINE